MNVELSPPEYTRVMTWDEAKLYCFALNIDGKIGWRMPSMLELHSFREEMIYSVSPVYPKPNRYWSKAEHPDYSQCIWVAVQFDTFTHTTWSGKDDNNILVRPVRDL